MRGQENDYDTDELYALFTDFTPEEIEEIYTQMQKCKWQFSRFVANLTRLLYI